MATHEEMMKELDHKLRNHDWYYAFSDDYSFVRRGEANLKEIQQLAKQCGRDGQRLLIAYKDINFGPHTGFNYNYPKGE